ncbi:MAG: DMT family transporter [Bacillota bacterium]
MLSLKKYLPLLSAFIFSVIFGFSFLFTKEGLEIIAPFHLLGFRFGMAAIALFFLKIFNIIKINFRGKKLKLLILLALVQPVLYFVFETTGIQLTTSSEAGLMISLIPVLVTILSVIFLGEKPTRLQVIFVIMSVLGVGFIMLMKGSLEVKANFLGLLFLFGAVFSGAVYNILSRKLSLNFTPVEITYIMMIFGAVIFNVIAYFNYSGSFLDYFMPLSSLKVLSSVIYLGIFSSVIAFFMMNYTLSRLEATKAAVFANLSTVISIIAGVLIRNEPFYWFQIIGSILIITGVFGTNYFDKKKKKEIAEEYNFSA